MTSAVRRAEFMMVLAYASDLATGQTRDFASRSCVLAMRLAQAAKLSEQEHRNVYHQSLLRYIGCNADTHLLTAAFGDEFTLRRDVGQTDIGISAERRALFIRALTRANAGAAPEELASLVELGLVGAPQVTIPVLAGHCEVAQRIGARIGLSPEICANLGQLYERWDGRGMPHGIKGGEVKFAVRLITLAQDAIIQTEALGHEGMRKVITARRGGAYEPELADILLADSQTLMAGLDDELSRETILSHEPQPHGMLDEAGCDEAYLAMADMIDMRMPQTMGHSRRVAKLATDSATKMGLPASDIRSVQWAACVHDIGELAVPVATWLKPTPFTLREMDEVHLHPYHGERALAALGSNGLGVSNLVPRHHERLDGSGYHRHVSGNDLSPAARVLATAEAFQTLREERPHRPALNDAAAATHLREMVREGKLCPDASAAVLAVLANRRGATRRSGWPGFRRAKLKCCASSWRATPPNKPHSCSISPPRRLKTTSRTSIPRSASRPAPVLHSMPLSVDLQAEQGPQHQHSK